MKSELRLHVVNKIRTMRQERKMSQKYLADCLNVSRSFIQKIESPKTNNCYNIEHMNILAKVFGCSIKDFFPEKPL